MKQLSEIKVRKQSEVLTDEEMKRIVGGSGECYFMCQCINKEGGPRYYKGDCSGPWDRTTECTSGLQTCYYLGA